MAVVDISTEVLDELKKDFGIQVVPFTTLISSDKEENVLSYTVADKVQGVELPRAKIGEQEAKQFFSALLNYHIDKYYNGGFFLADLKEYDFMYGNTSRNPLRKIYLVDLDHSYEFFNNSDPRSKNEYFSINLEHLGYLLNLLEKNSQSDFSQLRKSYLEFLREIKDSLHPEDQETIDNILEKNRKLTTEDMGVGLPKRRF